MIWNPTDNFADHYRRGREGDASAERWFPHCKKSRLDRNLALPLALLCLFILLSQQTIRADDELDTWRNNKQHRELLMNSYPRLAEHRLDHLMRLSLQDHFLTVSSPLPNLPMEHSVRIDSLPGIGSIRFQRDPITGTRFNLSVIDFPKEKQTTIISISYQPEGLFITHTTQFASDMQQVIVRQVHGTAPDGFQLTVSSTGAPPAQFEFSSRDFSAFVRDHTLETNQYLRPILRQFGAEATLAPETMTAWQVFSDLRRPDPLTAMRVRELLPALNDPDYHTRNEALTRLESLGRPACDVVDHLDRTTMTPEQNIRLDRFLARFEQLPPQQVARLRVDQTFLLDCLYCEDPAIRHAAVDRLRTMFRPDLSFDVDAPLEGRVSAVAALRQQVTPGK